MSQAYGLATNYMVSDHLGSTAVLTDQTGAVVERDAYDAWGKRRNLDGSDDTACALTSQTTRGFTGHEHIDDLCLIDANARLYDPTLGRFLSPDDIIPEPADMQSLNRFSYVRNRPLSVTDPTGHDDGCEVQECAPADGWRDPMFWNDFETSIDYSVGNPLSGLTSWGSSAAGAPDATAGAAAPSGPTGGSKSQNDQRNRERYWKVTHVHQNSDGTVTVAHAYVQGYIDSDGYLDVTDVYGTPTVETVADTDTESVNAPKGYFSPTHFYDLSKIKRLGQIVYQMGKYSQDASLGASLRMTYTGDVKDVRWIQTYQVTNSTRNESQAIDSTNPPFYYIAGESPGTSFWDIPGSTFDRTFHAETSLLHPNSHGGYDVITTVGWGYSRSSDSISLTMPQEVVPSPFHQTVLDSVRNGP